MLFICEIFRGSYLVLNGYLVLLCIHSDHNFQIVDHTFSLLCSINIAAILNVAHTYLYSNGIYVIPAVTGDPWLETRSRIFSVVRETNNVWLNSLKRSL